MGIVLAKDQVYETYFRKELHGEFDPEKVITNLKPDFVVNKPEYGWWGSPVDAYYGWKEWAENNGYDPEYGYDFEGSTIKWKLKPDSKIYQVGFEDVDNPKESELLKYICYEDCKDRTIYHSPTFEKRGNYSLGPSLNFEEMYKDGIVAVELMDAGIGHYFRNKLEEMFNGWDCESIVVLDSKKIIWL